MGDPTPGARQAMQLLQRRGLRVVVWTSRMSPEFNTKEQRAITLLEITLWMYRHNIPFNEVDDGIKGKRLGCVYIDDKGVGFNGDWPATIDAAMRIVDTQRAREREEDASLGNRD